MGTWSQHFSNVEGSFDLVECDRCAALVRKDVTPTKKHWSDHEAVDRALHALQTGMTMEPEPPRRYLDARRPSGRPVTDPVRAPGWGNR